MVDLGADYRCARFMPLVMPSGQAALLGNQLGGIGPRPERPLRMAMAVSALANSRNIALGPGFWMAACACKADALGQRLARLSAPPVLTAFVPAV